MHTLYMQCMHYVNEMPMKESAVLFTYVENWQKSN